MPSFQSEPRHHIIDEDSQLPSVGDELPNAEDYSADDPVGFVGFYVAMQARLRLISDYVLGLSPTLGDQPNRAASIMVQMESQIESWIENASDYLPAWAAHLAAIHSPGSMGGAR